MASLIDKLVPDDLWALVEPLLPPPPRPPYGGRHRTIPERNCLAALVFMARTFTPWALLPAQELGCGSASSAWRRLDQWATAGVFDQLHLEVLDRLGLAGRLDWSRASIDSMSVRAKRGGDHVGANPVDRGKPGSKIQLVCEGARAVADRGGDRRQRRGRDHAGGGGRRHPAGAHAVRPTAPPARQG